MTKATGFLCGIAAAAFATCANAIPVDTSGWSANNFTQPGGTLGNWSTASSGTTAIQSGNSLPTIYFDPTRNDRGNVLQAKARVGGSADDDFLGFVLGYDTGEIASGSADFWLIDWKKAEQTYNQSGVNAGTAERGLALSHITGNTAGIAANSLVAKDYWSHTGTVAEVAEGTTLGDAGWVHGTEYEFEIVYTSTLIEVSVNGTKQLSHSGSFGTGSFGFYGFSQSDLNFSEINISPVAPTPVPLPATLPLLAGALALAGVAERRRKAG